MLCFRAGVFREHVQLRGRDKKAPAVAVFDPDVILDDLIDLDLFDSPVNPQAVAFMDHIIPRRKLREILDPLAWILFLLLSLLLPSAEDICLRHQSEPLRRIFKTIMDMAVRHEDFSRLQDSLRILAVKSVQALIHEILREPLRPGSGTGQQDDPVTQRFVIDQIPGQQFKAAVVAGDRTQKELCCITVYPVRGCRL